MKKILLAVIVVFIFGARVEAQHYYNNRPSYPGHFNGVGYQTGYNYSGGWNQLRTPNGVRLHYRDGYVPMRGSRFFYPYANYNFQYNEYPYYNQYTR